MNELCVLAAHLDDGPCRGMELAGKAGLGKDLVDEPGADGGSTCLPPLPVMPAAAMRDSG